MPSCLAGIETEYPVAVFDKSGNRIEPRFVSDAMIRLASKFRFSLPSSQDKGVHIANGGKIYREAGRDQDYAITEFATAEASDPFELVRQVESGNLLMVDLCRRLREVLPDARLACAYRHNVCHVTQTSWATHCNVLTTSNSSTLVAHLVPHLVSKVIIAGGGGFALHEPFTFSLAPRMATFTSVINRHTTHERPLLNTREMSHCSVAARRQHLIGFEILCSHRARVLDVGTTMLITRMIDSGLRPGDGVELEAPIAALHDFCADPSCSVAARRKGSRAPLSAVDIQRCYLELALGHLHADFMPPWAARLCALWSETLDLLESGAPDSIADKLDWGMKLAVFREHASRTGGSWERCRDALLELDIRFGALDGGIFERLDAEGLLDHRVEGIDNIADALTTPPHGTRAQLRGEAILELGRAGRTGTAHWDRVCDTSSGRHLDLGDPFDLTVSWKPSS